ncbi:hypothetical protein OAQ47_07060 [Paracoccaceae bacterium]|nr:hypothetical protein [Paracoccaceae bacterium]
MKKILLATTALAMTTGYAAAEFSISASAKIAYGNFGEEHKPGNASKSATVAEGTVSTGTSKVASTAGLVANPTGAAIAGVNAGAVGNIAADTALTSGLVRLTGSEEVAATAATSGAGYAYSDTFDVVVSGSGEAMGVAYSASMTIDEDAGSNSVGTLSMSSNGFTLAYGEDDFGDLVADNANGLEEADGDIKLSYAANGISASYEMNDTAANPYYMRAGYTNGALTVGLEVADTDGSGAGKAVNTVSIGYTLGALTVSYDADDKATATGRNDAGSDYDAKITYTMGATVLSAGTDELQAHYAGISTTIGGLSLTMRTEQDGKKCVGTCGTVANGAVLSSAENELSLSYTMGALTVAYARDTGDAGKFGDEAETLTTLTYNMGGITLVGKGNDMGETEVSAAFSF